MRGIDEIDYYELLEISRGATQSEIDRAYRMAQRTYADGSLALYSVFENADAAAIRERFDEAYRVLSDSELRAQYDEHELPPLTPRSEARTTRSNGNSTAYSSEYTDHTDHTDGAGDATQTDAASRPTPLYGRPDRDGSSRRLDRYDSMDSVDEAVEEFDSLEDDGRGEFDGVRLRRSRMFRGLEIDDISDVTKVTCTHLRNIEAENFKDLPADVYVRGFVKAYAQTIGLDPTLVVPSYMARVEQSRGNPQRASFLARR